MASPMQANTEPPEAAEAMRSLNKARDPVTAPICATNFRLVIPMPYPYPVYASANGSNSVLTR